MTELFLKKPNLPQNNVSMMIMSDRFPMITNELQKNNIRVIPCEPITAISGSERYHADMSFCHIGDNEAFIFRGASSRLKNSLLNVGFRLTDTEADVTAERPSLNICIIGRRVLCNTKYADTALLNRLREDGFIILHTNQRYTKCTTAILNENAVITSDESVFRVCSKSKIDVLKISSGHILLKGYPYGFIGGCCGLVSKDTLSFSGNIQLHPDYESIRSFANNYHISLLSLSGLPLYDIGGILPLKEYI